MPGESHRGTKINQRVDASQITTFLCYTCGDMFQSQVDYQHHLLQHQAVSICTQIYYLDHLANKKGSRRGSLEDARSPAGSDQKSAGSDRPAPAEISTRRHTAPNSVERRASLELPPPRRERLPTNEDDMRKMKKQRKPAEKKKPRESIGYTEPQPKRQKVSSRYSLEETMIPFDERDGHLELIPQETCCPQCENNPTFRFPVLALSHCVKEHGASVLRTEFQFFSGNSLVFSKEVTEPGMECQRCGIKIETETLSHMHLLEHHIASVVEIIMKMKSLENITNIIGSVVVKMGNVPEMTVRFSATIYDK